jgi:hypothetical protein
MTPTEFDFRLKIPGDARLVSVIRQLTAHAAGYAQLDTASGEELAGKVERAAADAIDATTMPNGLIELHFCGDAEQIVVTLNWTAAAVPQSRQIRQRLTV